MPLAILIPEKLHCHGKYLYTYIYIFFFFFERVVIIHVAYKVFQDYIKLVSPFIWPFVSPYVRPSVRPFVNF